MKHRRKETMESMKVENKGLPIFKGERTPLESRFSEATGIQTFVFGKSKWTVEQAKKWLADHDFDNTKVDEPAGGDTIRFRQFDPVECDPRSYVSLTENFPDGVTAVSCTRRSMEGGPGSGNFGHGGVPGQHGGSAPGSGGRAATVTTGSGKTVGVSIGNQTAFDDELKSVRGDAHRITQTPDQVTKGLAKGQKFNASSVDQEQSATVKVEKGFIVVDREGGIGEELGKFDPTGEPGRTRTDVQAAIKMANDLTTPTPETVATKRVRRALVQLGGESVSKGDPSLLSRVPSDLFDRALDQSLQSGFGKRQPDGSIKSSTF